MNENLSSSEAEANQTADVADNEDETVIANESDGESVSNNVSKLPTYQDKISELNFDVKNYVITNDSSASKDANDSSASKDEHDKWIKKSSACANGGGDTSD